uniref:TM2 domain-containing protein 3 isoform X3 n=1 Tax=Castor canadensis TaxID=51338 RepID=A0A8B7VUZ9_CASCN|nr:TM2 domain-containing protein 3 isoform X3 [Castor canadensis]
MLRCLGNSLEEKEVNSCFAEQIPDRHIAGRNGCVPLLRVIELQGVESRFPDPADASDQEFRSQKNFIINMTCRFCWQLPETDYECSNSTSCMTVSCPRQRYTANCTVRDHIHCLGNRTFPKMLYCNWTGGYKWSTALALSHLGDETPIGSTYEARPLCRCVAASPLEALEQTASTWVSGAKAWASSSASEAWEYGH